MPCVPFKTGSGWGIACMGRSALPRCACGGRTDRLCDWKVGTERDGSALTCDAPVCSSCSVKPAPEKDLCPTHAEAWERWKSERAGA